MPDPGNDGRRQAYLAALGIPLWSGRTVFAQAAASDGLAFALYLDESAGPVEAEMPVVATPARAAGLMGDASAALAKASASEEPPADADNMFDAGPPDDGPPLEAYLDDPDIREAAGKGAQSGKAIARAVMTPPAAASTPARHEPALQREAPASEEDLLPVRFQFALFPCGYRYLVVPRFQLISPSEHKLLVNLLRALTSTPPQPVQFNWPMVNNHAIPQHRRAAREALAAFLTQQGKGARGYVVLGEHDVEVIALLQASTRLPVGAQASLGMLLQQPQRKKDVWLALQP